MCIDVTMVRQIQACQQTLNCDVTSADLPYHHDTNTQTVQPQQVLSLFSSNWDI